jgi:MFS family permease
MYRDLIFLAISLFTWGIGEGMFFIFQPIYLQELGASSVLIGAILGANGVIYALSQIPVGFLADRIGSQVLLRAAWIIAILGTIIMAIAPSLSIFIIGMLVYGLTAFVTTPLNSYTVSMRGNLTVQRALTLISASFQIGAIAGPYLGGYLGARFGLHAVYQFSLACFVPSTIVLFFLRRDHLHQPKPDQPRGSLTSNHILLGFVALCFLTTLATYLPQPLTPNFLQNQRQLSIENIGVLGSIGSLGNAFMALSFGGIRASPGFLIGQGFVALFTLVMWQGTSAWFFLGYFFLGGYRLLRLMSMAFTRSVIHGSDMGKAFGMLETANALASILAPILAGFLIQL